MYNYLFLFVLIFKTYAKNDVNFILCNNNEAVKLTKENLNLIDYDQKLVFLVHGWIDNWKSPHLQALINEFYTKGGYNVVAVDWSELSYALYFTQASVDTKLVGKILGKVIIKLHSLEYPLKNVHIIGHSLGAHIAGFAGQTVYKNLHQKVFRITGLDPASPKFENVILSHRDERLSDDDAEMVDVVHTDAGVAGMVEAIGTVDFYPNGGQAPQPHCVSNNVLSLVNPQFYACSHLSALHYYTESVNSDNFIAAKCTHYFFLVADCSLENKVVFGLNTPADSKGIYYFTTNSRRPYAKIAR